MKAKISSLFLFFILLAINLVSLAALGVFIFLGIQKVAILLLFTHVILTAVSVFIYLLFIGGPLKRYKMALSKGEDLDADGCKDLVNLATFLNKYKRNLLRTESEKNEIMETIEERKRKARAKFLGYISHDLRTPMNAIVGFTSIAQSILKDIRYDSPEISNVNDCVNKIGVSANLLQNLVNGMLDLGVVQSDSFLLKEEVFKLDEVIDGVRTVIAQLAEDKSISFNMRVEKSLDLSYCGDTYRLSQVFLNILGNAVKFTQENGLVECIVKELQSTKDDELTLRIICMDNGCGMSKEFIPHIYEYFIQEKRAKNVMQGPGIGMSITKKIIDLMKGTIKVDSEINKGTTVTVDVPLKIAK